MWIPNPRVKRRRQTWPETIDQVWYVSQAETLGQSSCWETQSEMNLSCLLEKEFCQEQQGNHQVKYYCLHYSLTNSDVQGRIFQQWEDTSCLRNISNEVPCQKAQAFPTSFLTSAPQVLIPSVKLDYSHVQSRCGSLDRRGYSARGGNVSLVLQVHCISVHVSVTSLLCCVSFCVCLCVCFIFHFGFPVYC